jgi:hypothetical protein
MAEPIGTRACAREPKRDQDQPVDIPRFRFREQRNNRRSKRDRRWFEHRRSSQRKRIGREGAHVLVPFQVKTRLALIACNPGYRSEKPAGFHNIAAIGEILAIVTQIRGRGTAKAIQRSGVRRVPLSEIKDDLSRFLREAEGEVKAASPLRRAPNRHRSAGGRVCRASRHDRRRWQGARHLQRANPTCAAPRSEPPSGTVTATPGPR